MKVGFAPIQGDHRFEETVEQVQFADRNGLDSAFLQEHHETDGNWPDPVSVINGLATITDTIELGTAVLLLPLYHPIRLAEQVAIADGLSDGRFVLGSAIGYRPREFDVLNVDRRKRGKIYEEYLTLITRLWTEDRVTFDGEFYQVEDFRCTPRPANDERPTVWIGGYHEIVLNRAAKFIQRGLADAWFPGTQPDIEGLVSRRTELDEMLSDRGVDPSTTSMPLMRDGIIAPTREEAVEMAENHVEGYKEKYQGRGHGETDRGDLAHDVIRDEDFDPQDLIQDRFIVGNPDDWVQELRAYEESLGVDHVVLRIHYPDMTHNDVMDRLELLCDDVVPRL